MKAVRVNQWGQPLQIENLPQPTPADGEVLVRTHAASINPVDAAIALGYMANYVSAPLTLGTDIAGEVVAIGDGVSHLKPGDAVYGISVTRGTFAEYATVNAIGLAVKPASYDYVQAAAVPLTGLSAWQALFQTAQLKSGERVLIHGAGGGIGTLAIQLAKNAGAYVIAHDKGDKADLLKNLGADEVINAETERFEDKAGHVDVILDLVRAAFVERSLAILGQGGRYVTPANQLDSKLGEERGVIVTSTFTQPSADQLNTLTQAIDAGKLKVLVSKIYPLDDIQTALYANPVGGGKVVIRV